jgi:hypothetical protein
MHSDEHKKANPENDSIKLKRNYLEKMYLTFIRPILEYASEVWFNCGQFNSNRLEKVQIEAAFCVSGTEDHNFSFILIEFD